MSDHTKHDFKKQMRQFDFKPVVIYFDFWLKAGPYSFSFPKPIYDLKIRK